MQANGEVNALLVAAAVNALDAKGRTVLELFAGWSCDAASLARDAADLKAVGFRPRSVQLFDMFPQTHHVETLMTFER